MDQQSSLKFSIANILRETKPAFKGSVISLPFCAPAETRDRLSAAEGTEVFLAANFTTLPVINVSAHATCIRCCSGTDHLCPSSVICGLDTSCEINQLKSKTFPNKEKAFKRKKRTSFTITQIRELESKFNQQKYLTRIDRHLLARSLGLTEKHVKTWYQNRRTKWKRSCTEQDWSKQREDAATVMYSQHIQLKKTSSTRSRPL